jgi:8-oxo-dGTP diphosphatase
MKHQGEYVPPIVTVDGVIFQLIDDQLCVLLIQRTQDPFAGSWALPGGYSARGETTADAMKRILAAKAGVAEAHLTHMEQFQVFDSIARDPRGHAVSIAYLGLGREIDPAQGSTQHPTFYPLSDLPKLAFDHAEVIQRAQQRLRAEVASGNSAVALLPKLFTLTELQNAYEAIMGNQIDKRNFRKKIMAMEMLEETDEQKREGAHRPAKLYTFKQQKPQAGALQFA